MKGPKFPNGASTPHAQLPFEFVMSFPGMEEAELKVTIVAFALAGESVPIETFVEKTGLSEAEVRKGLNDAIERGMVRRAHDAEDRCHAHYR